MGHDYNLITQEIIDNVGIPSNDIFYYDGVPLAPVFSSYFQFCQENLNITGDKFGIKPARIFFKNDVFVNAFASYCNNYFIIGVNAGIIVNLYHFFVSKAELFLDGSLSFLSSFNQELAETREAPIFHLMQQVCSQFTYYHELAHLIQRSPQLSDSIEEKYFAANSSYSAQQHVYEFDADLYGAEYIAFHLLEFWKKLSIDMRTAANLSYLFAMGVSAIFSYFLILMGDYRQIYYAEHSHPHPLVRVLYVVDGFIKTAEGNLQGQININPNEVIQNAFKITSEIFKADGRDFVAELGKIYLRERRRIKLFVDNDIIGLVPLMPELVYNRVRR